MLQSQIRKLPFSKTKLSPKRSGKLFLLLTRNNASSCDSETLSSLYVGTLEPQGRTFHEMPGFDGQELTIQPAPSRAFCRRPPKTTNPKALLLHGPIYELLYRPHITPCYQKLLNQYGLECVHIYITPGWETASIRTARTTCLEMHIYSSLMQEDPVLKLSVTNQIDFVAIQP